MSEEIEDFHYSEERDDRVKETAEVFTPASLVNKMLNDLGVDWDNIPDDKTFLDPTCGSGNFLVELARRGVHPKNIYGVDLMDDNIETTHNRLTEIFLNNGLSLEDIEYHMDRNIVQGDALEYHYEFWDRSNSIIDDNW